jgi:hypothetical protein
MSQSDRQPTRKLPLAKGASWPEAGTHERRIPGNLISIELHAGQRIWAWKLAGHSKVRGTSWALTEQGQPNPSRTP